MSTARRSDLWTEQTIQFDSRWPPAGYFTGGADPANYSKRLAYIVAMQEDSTVFTNYDSSATGVEPGYDTARVVGMIISTSNDESCVSHDTTFESVMTTEAGFSLEMLKLDETLLVTSEITAADKVFVKFSSIFHTNLIDNSWCDLYDSDPDYDPTAPSFSQATPFCITAGTTDSIEFTPSQLSGCSTDPFTFAYYIFGEQADSSQVRVAANTAS